VGQYELELIEAEKYIGEIKNILKKLGVISKDISGKNEIKKKRGRGRPSKALTAEAKQVSGEKFPETKKKKKGKPGRPRKRGPKKDSKRKANAIVKPVEAKTAVPKAAEIKRAAKKVVKKKKPARQSAKSKKKKVSKPAPVRTIPAATAAPKNEGSLKKGIAAPKEQIKKNTKPAPKKTVVKKASKEKAGTKKKPAPEPVTKAVAKPEVKTTAPAVPPVVMPEEKPAEA